MADTEVFAEFSRVVVSDPETVFCEVFTEFEPDPASFTGRAVPRAVCGTSVNFLMMPCLPAPEPVPDASLTPSTGAADFVEVGLVWLSDAGSCPLRTFGDVPSPVVPFPISLGCCSKEDL
ncbi:hypothetical protein [Streptomyces sp. RKAG337]|uniref:hypothetical protein n=1 Tax=Streptomyces sp. RKAG337 TaxID=2893404 RepID=UPI0020336C2A|nr:hypothetical protein [Streptomyces sp. RKAG337]MCM2430050.1 hypothetical protein [Streptomyces sp. RKAG337]